MKKKNREKLRLITLRVCIGVLCAFVIAVFIRSYYYRSKESNLDIKSRYTFTVDIDAYGDVIDGPSTLQVSDQGQLYMMILIS